MGIGAGISAITLLEGCATMPLYKTKPVNNELQVPESSFLESKLLLVRVAQFDYDILLVKGEENTFTALYMKCSHMDQPLTATNDGIFCASHGSKFTLEGKVTKEPALKDLRTFPTHYSQPTIFIKLA